MSGTQFDIAPFSFSEASDELWGEDERGRPSSPRRAARPAAARPRPQPRPPQRPPQRPAPRRPRPASGYGLSAVTAPCVCPAHRSEYVRWVQSALNRIDNAGLTVDGVMSPSTRSALRAFQTRKGLPVDGIAGPDTEQALRGGQGPVDSAEPAEPAEPGELFEFETLEFESGASSMPTLRSGSRGSAVTDLQRRLAAAGFNPGPADGIFGGRTDAAVRSFQRSRGLSADGIVGPMTWAALLNTQPGPAPAPPASGGSGGSGPIRYGKGWGGSEGVADAAKAIAASMGVRVTSEKRDLAATIRVGSSTSSDHYTGNTNAYAVDLGVSGTRGDELARAIATQYGIPLSVIGTYTRTTIQVGDRRYSLQLLWRVTGHYDHVHLGIRRA
jgi:peptidoglycan hydrolase-like protein with peptidoglycan-binding domain